MHIGSVADLCVVHHNGDFWSEPERFHPDRWMNDSKTTFNNGEIKTFLPFTLGSYHCVGKLFALQELRLVIATLVLRYNMQAAPGFNVEAYSKNIKASELYYFDGSLDVVMTKRS